MAITTASTGNKRRRHGGKARPITGKSNAKRRNNGRHPQRVSLDEMAQLQTRAAGMRDALGRTLGRIERFDGYAELIAEARPEEWSHLQATFAWLNEFAGTPLDQQLPLTVAQFRRGGTAINSVAKFQKQLNAALRSR